MHIEQNYYDPDALLLGAWTLISDIYFNSQKKNTRKSNFHKSYNYTKCSAIGIMDKSQLGNNSHISN